MRTPFLVFTLAVAAAIGTAAPSTRAERAAEVVATVYFTRGEQLAPVARAVADTPPVEPALRALFAGPTRVERARGLRTNIPASAMLNAVEMRGDVAHVDVSAAFVAGRNRSVQARLAQLVYTATRAGARAVRLSVDGDPVERAGGMVLEEPIGRGAFGPVPAGGAPAAPPPRPFSQLVRSIQQELIELRYLPSGGDDGRYGPQTRHAILAFQGWEGLRRDGRPTRVLLARVRRADVPQPRRGTGRRIEVSIARQVALVVEGATVLRVIHVSTGARGFETPRGSFRVFRKELRSWSYPYRVWLPYASYFVGGVAFHESPDVPAYPASHGCVRVPRGDAPYVYRFASLGTRVVVA